MDHASFRWIPAKLVRLGCVLLAVGLIASTNVNAQVYRWVDANGKVHFSDAEPPKGSRDVKQVDVGETNVVRPFQYRQTTEDAPQQQPTEPESGSAASEDTGKRTQRTVAEDKDSCAAQKAAYEASAACFAECGRTFRSATGSYARNNANCGHCTEAVAPNCRE